MVRGRITRNRLKLIMLKLMIWRYRQSNAIKIQKVMKRVLAQRVFNKILILERTLPSIKWLPDSSNTNSVHVIGQFPLNKPIELKYCYLRKIFIRYVRGLYDGDYEIMFIVDGSYRVSGRMPVLEKNGNSFVNVLEIDGFKRPKRDSLSYIEALDTSIPSCS